MVDLLLDLKNPFANIAITDPKIDPFTGSAINKLVDVNLTGEYAGMFTAPIAILNLAYTPFHASILKLPIDLTFGAGSVEVRSKVVSEFQSFVSNFKGIVKDKYYVNQHNKYIQFYVNDLKDYSNMNKTNSLSLINRYASAVHTNVADFTPDFDAKAASFFTRYNDAVEDQDTRLGSIINDRSTRDTGRTALNDALFEAYNFCKYKFKCDYNKMHYVFPLETLLRHPRHEINHYNGSIDALATVNVTEAIYDTTFIAMVRNTSGSDILAGLAPTAETAINSTTGVLIKAMKSKSFVIASTGTPDDHFLNITNINLTDPAIWEVDIFEQS